MNLLLSLVLSLFMSAAATPSSPLVQEFIEASNTELDGQGYATYEETADGAAVVYVLCTVYGRRRDRPGGLSR